MRIQTPGGSFLVLAMCTVLLAGCATNGLVYSERPVPLDKSLVYVYREGRILGAANSWTLFANGQTVTDIGNGGYYDFTVEPGRVEFTSLLDLGFILAIPKLVDRAISPDAKPVASLQAEPGRVYYFKFALGNKMTQVTSDEAIKTMTGMRRFHDPQSAPK